MKNIISICISTVVLFFAHTLYGQTGTSYLIMDDVAIFYPENFNANDHLPSFALVQETGKKKLICPMTGKQK